MTRRKKKNTEEEEEEMRNEPTTNERKQREIKKAIIERRNQRLAVLNGRNERVFTRGTVKKRGEKSTDRNERPGTTRRRRSVQTPDAARVFFPLPRYCITLIRGPTGIASPHRLIKSVIIFIRSSVYLRAVEIFRIIRRSL